jgi:hypothetical protein
VDEAFRYNVPFRRHLRETALRTIMVQTAGSGEFIEWFRADRGSFPQRFPQFL